MLLYNTYPVTSSSFNDDYEYVYTCMQNTVIIYVQTNILNIII